MEALIAKNENFETVGFEVKNENEVIFKWGVAPLVDFYYVKSIRVKENMNIIFELVALEKALRTYSKFTSMFFDVARTNSKVEEILMKGEEGFNFKEVDQQIQNIERRIKDIICKLH